MDFTEFPEIVRLAGMKMVEGFNRLLGGPVSELKSRKNRYLSRILVQ